MCQVVGIERINSRRERLGVNLDELGKEGIGIVLQEGRDELAQAAQKSVVKNL